MAKALDCLYGAEAQSKGIYRIYSRGLLERKEYVAYLLEATYDNGSRSNNSQGRGSIFPAKQVAFSMSRGEGGRESEKNHTLSVHPSIYQ